MKPDFILSQMPRLTNAVNKQASGLFQIARQHQRNLRPGQPRTAYRLSYAAARSAMRAVGDLNEVARALQGTAGEPEALHKLNTASKNLAQCGAALIDLNEISPAAADYFYRIKTLRRQVDTLADGLSQTLRNR